MEFFRWLTVYFMFLYLLLCADYLNIKICEHMYSVSINHLQTVWDICSPMHWCIIWKFCRINLQLIIVYLGFLCKWLNDVREIRGKLFHEERIKSLTIGIFYTNGRDTNTSNKKITLIDFAIDCLLFVVKSIKFNFSKS